MPILAIGLSHHTAPVEMRDQVAIPSNAFHQVLGDLRELPPVSEAAVLSTCNRTEAYVVTEGTDEVVRGVVEVLCRRNGVDPDAFNEHLFVHRDLEAVHHLFSVASGLDSMIMGEPQIAGQVKDAGAMAMETGASSRILNRLFRSVVEASKRARTETEIAAGAVSVSFAAVELARKIFGELSQHTVLVLGAGEMSELTALHLVEHGVSSPIVASRTEARAQQLADKVKGRAMGWDDALANLHQADIVISSTSAPYYILQKPAVAAAMERRRNRQMFLIDIAVPRDIAPDVGELYNVLLYDIDDLQAVVGANLKKRQAEAEKARLILEDEVASFQAWMASLDVVPTIVALRKHFQAVMEAELNNAKLNDLSEEQKARVGVLLKQFTNKLLHAPVTRLKALAEEGDGTTYVESVLELFDLAGAVRNEIEETKSNKRERVER